MKKLYKFYWYCGRSGNVEGLFIAEEQDVEEAVGCCIHFGEILGKHSDVYGTLDDVDLEVIDIPEEVSNILKDKLGSTISGYNPLEFIHYECSECEEEHSYDDCNWFKNAEGERVCEFCADDYNGELTQV